MSFACLESYNISRDFREEVIDSGKVRAIFDYFRSLEKKKS
jgi:hypothetical protein